MNLEEQKELTEPKDVTIKVAPIGHRHRKPILVVTGLTIIVIIMILGYFGWKLYSRHTPKPVAPQTVHASAHPTDPNAGYFVIKEWGVRFKLPSSLSGLEYKMISFSDDPSDSYADFYTTKLATLVPDCNPLAGSWSVGIGRLLRYPVSNQQPIGGGAGLLTSFGGYNYYFGHQCSQV